ncbi:MAG: hypothetical protein WC385_03075 [Candidatus Paceibacterota bacterium]|jgi:hypothetical protein
MDKKLIWGLGAIATAGAIAGGAYLSQNNPFNLKPSPDVSAEDQQKIEQLYFDELKDKERYTFCQGKEKITGTYKNSIVGSESGQVDYRSEDISVFDKEINKLYILGRTIDYKYSGSGDLSNLVGEGSLETKESGNITEYYKKNMAPVRLDYNANILYPAPERKKTDWVVVTTKSIGTVMGLTQERVDEETGDAKVLCPYFSLAGGPLKNGAIITPDSFSFRGTCPDNSPNPGVSFSGNFEFECNNIGSPEGIELLKNYKEKEELRDNLTKINDAGADSSQDNDFKGIINSQEKADDPEALRVKLEEMKKEMQADQR